MCMSNPVGKPPKFNTEQMREIYDDLDVYIRTNEDPAIVRFVANYYKYDVVDQYIYERPEYAGLVKRAIKKQEAYLISCEKNPTMAIFRLKQPQHGYRDKTEVATTIDATVNVTNVDPTMAADFTEFLKQRTIGDIKTTDSDK